MFTSKICCNVKEALLDEYTKTEDRYWTIAVPVDGMDFQ